MVHLRLGKCVFVLREKSAMGNALIEYNFDFEA